MAELGTPYPVAATASTVGLVLKTAALTSGAAGTITDSTGGTVGSTLSALLIIGDPHGSVFPVRSNSSVNGI